MQAVTLTLAGFFSVLVLLSRPTRALAVYLILLLAYPTFLVVQVGSLDISAARIVGGVLLLRCLLNSDIAGKMKWCKLDTWALLVLVVTVGVPLMAWKMPPMKVLENRGGFAMDTVMAYFLARFCVRDYRALISIAKWVTPVVVALGILGILESSYGIQPFFALRKYCPWRSAGGGLTTNVRSGFFRAVGPSGHPILFGASFVMFVPMLWSLRHEAAPWKTRAYLAVAFASIGALSSMSSGPWMMIFMMFGAFILERHKGVVKPLLWFGIGSCFIVDIISNRTFYHVMASYANPIGGSGWHRARLIDLAIEHFGEWWFLGYRGQDPGWGSQLGMTFTDITNHYIMMGVFYGAWGMIALIGLMATAVIMIIRAHNRTKDKKFRSWCWAFGSLLAVLAISFTSCTLFDQSQTYFYAVMGIIGSMTLGQPALEKSQERLRMARLAQSVTRPRDPVVAV